MSDAGWFSDPTGRFGQRWYDGANWTDDVVGASGAVVADPLPRTGIPFAPPRPYERREVTPPQAAQPPAPQPAEPEWQPARQYGRPEPQQYGTPEPRHYGTPERQQSGTPEPQQSGWTQSEAATPSGQWSPFTETARYAPGMGLVLSAIGVLLVALSLFALKWADADKGTFLDLSKSARSASGDRFSNVYGEPTYLYSSWAGFVLVALTALLVLAAGLPLPHSAAGNTYPRIIGSVVAGGAAVLQTIAIVHVFKGPADPEFGAWLGVAGYLVIVAGMVVGARRVRV